MACAQEVLAVSSRPAFALHWLIPNIVAFQLSHLDLDVRVSTLHGDDESALDEGVADLSVRYGRPGPANPLRVILAEWRAVARDLARPGSLVTRLTYVFGPPGWRAMPAPSPGERP